MFSLQVSLLFENRNSQTRRLRRLSVVKFPSRRYSHTLSVSHCELAASIVPVTTLELSKIPRHLVLANEGIPTTRQPPFAWSHHHASKIRRENSLEFCNRLNPVTPPRHYNSPPALVERLFTKFVTR